MVRQTSLSDARIGHTEYSARHLTDLSFWLAQWVWCQEAEYLWHQETMQHAASRSLHKCTGEGPQLCDPFIFLYIASNVARCKVTAVFLLYVSWRLIITLLSWAWWAGIIGHTFIIRFSVLMQHICHRSNCPLSPGDTPSPPPHAHHLVTAWSVIMIHLASCWSEMTLCGFWLVPNDDHLDNLGGRW